MSLLPEPLPGLVVRYSYLWYREHPKGQEEGSKDRPCAIVAAIRKDELDDTRVLVLPITHSPPKHERLPVELPAAVKRRLGLDEVPSGVVVSEWTDFGWPRADLRHMPNSDDSSVAYGMLPPSLFDNSRRSS